MKYSIIIILLSITFFSCEKTPNELIIGTWIGTKEPDIDKVIFTENTVEFIGRAVIEGKLNYSIDADNIYISLSSGSELICPYKFEGKNRIYIEKILTQGYFGLNDINGIEFSK